MTQNEAEWSGMKQNEAERSRMKQNEAEWSGMKQNDAERSRMKQNEAEWSKMKQNEPKRMNQIVTVNPNAAEWSIWIEWRADDPYPDVEELEEE